MNRSRRWKVIALLALVALAPWSPAGATEPRTKSAAPGQRPAGHKLTRKSYPVADLVDTIAQGSAGAGGADLLVRAVVCAVKPTSWDKRGGPGTIEYAAQTKSLVVNQTAEVHGRIAAVLKALSMVQPKQKAPAAISPTAFAPSPPTQHKQYGHFVLDNVRVNAMGVSCTIRRIRMLYKGDGVDADVAKCAMTGGESEKKADVPKVLTDLLEKVSKAEGAPTAPTCTPAVCAPSSCPANLSPPCPPPQPAPDKAPKTKARSNNAPLPPPCTCP
jgi:hypothetical protein